MIDRYSRKVLRDLWSEEEKYKYWGKVERAHLEVLTERHIAPKTALDDFDSVLAQKTVDDYLSREKETGHDVIAFIAEVSESMKNTGSFLHKGLTSSDIVDTALVLRIKQSIKLLSESLQKVLDALKKRSFEFHDTLCIGRTHGIHAEPLSFGQVLASHFAEFKRAFYELHEAEKHISFGKLSGAVGNYTQLDPDFEVQTLKKLNLDIEPISTQIIPRDRILTVAKALLSLANAVDRISTNIRHWGRTELGEILEPFSKKQKGSSAMPHKKNPILTENLCGLARTVRGNFVMLMENGALWHERDISHSSVERIALPDMFATVDFMLSRLSNVIANMHINTQALSAQIWRTGGLWASQNILTALVEKGINRIEAYECVQRVALELHTSIAEYKTEWSHKDQAEFNTKPYLCPFFQLLQKDNLIQKHLTKDELQQAFSMEKYLKYVPNVFKRVFGFVKQNQT